MDWIAALQSTCQAKIWSGVLLGVHHSSLQKSCWIGVRIALKNFLWIGVWIALQKVGVLKCPGLQYLKKYYFFRMADIHQ